MLSNISAYKLQFFRSHSGFDGSAHSHSLLIQFKTVRRSSGSLMLRRQNFILRIRSLNVVSIVWFFLEVGGLTADDDDIWPIIITVQFHSMIFVLVLEEQRKVAADPHKMPYSWMVGRCVCECVFVCGCVGNYVSVCVGCEYERFKDLGKCQVKPPS